MSDRVGRIQQKISEGLSPLQCDVKDESALHAGHAGAASGGGHYRLHLVSDRFEGLGRLARHRLVYDCLADMMHKEIHALAIVALTPSEAAQQPGK
jgi:BolA family transcriptional regulator, general stress-responsive regulator